jgi:hypothetical protein
MTQSPAFPLPPLPPPQFVGVDTPCRNCSYNLRTLPTSAVCPECGLPVALSLRSDLLRFSNPDWLILIRRGMLCMFVGVLAILILSRGFGGRIRFGGGIGILQQAIAEGMVLIGAWIMTTPDPGGLGEEQYGIWRRAVRALVFIRAAEWIAQRLFTSFALTLAAPGGGLPLDLLAASSYLISAALSVAELAYLRGLAARLPNLSLRATARMLMFAMPAILIAMSALVVVTGLPKIGARAVSNLHIALGLILIGYLVVTVFFLSLISRWQRELKGEIQAAKIRWANPTTPPPAA